MTAPHRTIGTPERDALVTVETAERLAGHIARALEAGDTARAFALLGALVDETTIRTCTNVKSPADSDIIARAAAADVRNAIARVDAQLAAETEAERLAEAEHDAETDRRIAEHEADLASRGIDI